MSALPAPDFSRGYVKWPRSVLRELLPDLVALGTYGVIIERAAYNAGPRLVRGHGVQWLEIGQAYIGRADIAKAIGVGERSVRTALDKLVKLGFVTVEPSKLGTKVTVRGYGEISDDDGDSRPTESPAADQQATNKRPTDRPLTKKERQKDGETKETGIKPVVHRLFDFWSSQYKAKHGDDYVIAPQEWRVLKQLSEALDADEVERRMAISFEAPPSFPAQPWSLRVFWNCINQCAKPTEARVQTNGRSGRVEPSTANYEADLEASDDN